MKENPKARLSLKKESLVKLNESQKSSIKGGLAPDTNTVGCTGTCTGNCPTGGTATRISSGCCIPPCW